MPPKKKKKKPYIDPVTRANNARVVREMEAEVAKERHPSGQWEQGGQKFTANATDDKKAPDGYYLSVKEGREHATAVYNSDDTFADTKANRDWKDAE